MPYDRAHFILKLVLSYFNYFLIFINSQSLINLLLTGHAVSNVWDGDRECSGMSKYICVLIFYD